MQQPGAMQLSQVTWPQWSLSKSLRYLRSKPQDWQLTHWRRGASAVTITASQPVFRALLEDKQAIRDILYRCWPEAWKMEFHGNRQTVWKTRHKKDRIPAIFSLTEGKNFCSHKRLYLQLNKIQVFQAVTHCYLFPKALNGSGLPLVTAIASAWFVAHDVHTGHSGEIAIFFGIC